MNPCSVTKSLHDRNENKIIPQYFGADGHQPVGHRHGPWSKRMKKEMKCPHVIAFPFQFSSVVGRLLKSAETGQPSRENTVFFDLVSQCPVDTRVKDLYLEGKN